MSVIVLVLGLAVGGLVGYVAGNSAGFKSVNTKLTAIQAKLKSSSGTSTASTQSVAACVEEKLGKEKAAVVVANPKLASAEDNFAVLPCYNQ